MDRLTKLRALGVSIYHDRWRLWPHPQRLYEVRIEARRDVDDDYLLPLRSFAPVSFLYVRHTSVAGPFLRDAACHKHLEYLDAGETMLNDAGVSALRRFHRLRVLILDNTVISDEALPTLAMLPSLYYLVLTGTDLSEEGLSILSSSRSLAYVCLSGRQFPGKQSSVENDIGSIEIKWINK